MQEPPRITRVDLSGDAFHSATFDLWMEGIRNAGIRWIMRTGELELFRNRRSNLSSLFECGTAVYEHDNRLGRAVDLG